MAKKSLNVFAEQAIHSNIVQLRQVNEVNNSLNFISRLITIGSFNNVASFKESFFMMDACFLLKSVNLGSKKRVAAI